MRYFKTNTYFARIFKKDFPVGNNNKSGTVIFCLIHSTFQNIQSINFRRFSGSSFTIFKSSGEKITV